MHGSISGNIRNALFWENIRKGFFWENIGKSFRWENIRIFLKLELRSFTFRNISNFIGDGFFLFFELGPKSALGSPKTILLKSAYNARL